MSKRRPFSKNEHSVLQKIGISAGIGVLLLLLCTALGAGILLLVNRPTRAAGGVMLALLLVAGGIHGFLISRLYESGEWSGRIGILIVALLMPIGSLLLGGNIGGGFLNGLIYAGAAMLTSFLPKRKRR